MGDITKVDETALKPFNMICGGSPCQDFSVAGDLKGSIWSCSECNHQWNPLVVHYTKRNNCPYCGSALINKTRSSLLIEFLRIIRSNKPNFGIYENVKNIVSKRFKDTTFKMFEKELQEYGYNTYWKVLNAKDFGIPQNRERLYLIFINKEIDNGKFEFPEPISTNIKLKDLLENQVDKKFYILTDAVKDFIQDINKDTSKTFQEKSSQVIQIGNLVKDTKSWSNPMRGRVYSVEGYSPTLNTCNGGQREPKILETSNYVELDNYEENIKIKQATKKGYIEVKPGGVADLSYPNSNTRRGRVQDGGDCCPTITANETGICKFESLTKIRKLTPKECFRLMGFSDKDFDAALNSGMSNTQLYKQAGNSIVVDVLFYIYEELYKAMPYLFEDLRLSSFFSGIGAFETALDRLYERINDSK